MCKNASDADQTTGVLVPAVAAETAQRDLDNHIFAYDHSTELASGITAADVAGYFTNGGTADTFTMAANGAGVLVTGSSEDTPESPIQIWWIDSGLDGDGTDVTANDVKLLVQSADLLDLNLMTAEQLLV